MSQGKKDQERVREKFLPTLMDRIVSNDPDAITDCTVVNRQFIQGPDPLFLMLTCPDQFRHLCSLVSLSLEEGQHAIQEAHEKGPGVLLEGTGLDPHLPWIDDVETLPKAHRAEILWLLLARVSNCTEDGYSTEVSLRERTIRAMRAATELQVLLAEERLALVGLACEMARVFISTTTFEVRDGIPHASADHAFYVLYKQGYNCVAVHTPNGLVFYGTTPDSSLAAHGVKVDKEITPQFGLVYNRE